MRSEENFEFMFIRLFQNRLQRIMVRVFVLNHKKVGGILEGEGVSLFVFLGNSSTYVLCGAGALHTVLVWTFF